MSVAVTIEGLRAELGGAEVLHGIDLDLRPREFVTLLGPSGSGKTTTLNIVAGFIRQSAGTVSFDAVRIDDLPPFRRDLGFVFQSYALFPHLSVGENIAFPLRARRLARAERARLVDEVLELVDLSGMATRRVRSLSGGQQQRVALARALVFKPRVLLLDEPLAALDKSLREAMQGELKRIQHEVGVTTIAVTHDQTEAMTMSDRVGVMRDGVFEQVGTPSELYGRPASLFVASFLGEANLLQVDDRGYIAALDLAVEQGPGIAVIRPEDVAIVSVNGRPSSGHFRVEQVDYQGWRYRVVCASETTGERVTVSAPPDTDGAVLERGRLVSPKVEASRRVHVLPHST
jgi:putative spermidine/putrescine transport system ATP-binding protein